MNQLLMVSFAVSLSLISPNAQAFNGLVHEQLVKSAFRYLDTHAPLSPATTKWIALGEVAKTQATQNEIERLLIRSAVDIDYVSDLWLDAWFITAFAGGKTKYFGMLTSLYHFINVSAPGQYWPYDGYSYARTDGTGNDAYLGLPGLTIRGDLCKPLGGSSTGKYCPLGAYRLAFKGNDIDWNRLFHRDGSMSTSVLPPSNVPATLAYDYVIKSKRALADKIEVWTDNLQVAENYIFSRQYERRFKRQEIRGLPSALDNLGITIHMAQDLAVPHHSLGIAGHCHNEFESRVDRLSCGENVDLEQDDYDSGLFDIRDGRLCQQLYDPIVVEQLMANDPLFKILGPRNVFEFLIELAKTSARWKWGVPEKNNISAADCNSLVQKSELTKFFRLHYNLAVAATIVIIESAAQDYEKLN